jgi:alpha-galactosidase
VYVLGAVLALVCGCGGEYTTSTDTATAFGTAAAGKRLKIYVLAGQSNMQGKARPHTIARMALSPESKDLHDKLVDSDGAPRVLENTHMVYFTGSDGKKRAYKLDETSGKLTVFNGSFGPEFAFGVTMDEKVDQPILIIKTAWGGRDLHTDFRPPSAGTRLTNPATAEKWKEEGTYEENMAKRKEQFEDGGRNYRLMLKLVRSVLADPKKYHPAYDEAAGYEIAGFVWFQGYNDMIGPYPSDPKGGRGAPKDYSEYSRLMACFIRDVRKDFSVPDMPFVIGVMGLGGNTDGAFQKAQAAPAEWDEFKGNVAAVFTGKYWDHEMEKLNPKAEEVRRSRDHAHEFSKDGKKLPAVGWKSIGTPAPEERQWRYLSISPEPGKTYQDRCEGFFFYVADSDELKDWYKPGFDDSSWKSGKAPIGNGTAWGKKSRRNQEPAVKPVSDWGDGDYLLMRTTFEVDNLDYEHFRLAILARLGYIIYLNGKEINNYYWYYGPCYRTRKKGYTEGFGPDNLPLKKGTNLLAIYANATFPGKTSPPVVIDADIEGLTKEGAKEVKAFEESIMPERELIIGLAKSNAGFHYNGSAYTYSLIGEAFANAILEMKQTN